MEETHEIADLLRSIAELQSQVALITSERDHLLNQLQKKAEGSTSVTKSTADAHLRYFDEFIVDLRCSSAFLDLRIFPDAKELTETMAAFNAVRKHLFAQPKVSVITSSTRKKKRKRKHKGLGSITQKIIEEPSEEVRLLSFDPNDQEVALIAVGDGQTPRVATMFAYRTRWTCFSIDPALRKDGPWNDINRLFCFPQKIEEFDFEKEVESRRLGPFHSVVVVMIHCHTDLIMPLNSIRGGWTRNKLGVVACPCCNWRSIQSSLLEFSPHQQYQDVSMASECNDFRVWKFSEVDLISDILSRCQLLASSLREPSL